MKNIRVLVANRPRLMRELMLATIADQPDIEIVGEIEDEADIRKAIGQTQPNFVIVALQQSNRLPEGCESILKDFPNLRIIAIAPERNSSMFYWASLKIQSNRIEASEQGVLGALRSRTSITGGAS